MNSLRNMRYIALIEATSFLALLVATYFKHFESSPGGVTVLGPIHGILFLTYVYIAFNVREQARWSNQQLRLVLLGAVLPFGGYVVDTVFVKPALAQS